MPPAARVGDMHTCPMQTPGTPPIPHVGGPVLPAGCPTVLIGGQPAARVGDLCTCVGPPDSIAKGSATVLIGTMPAARQGDNTAHGGVITLGHVNTLIGDMGASGTGSGGTGGGFGGFGGGQSGGGGASGGWSNAGDSAQPGQEQSTTPAVAEPPLTTPKQEAEPKTGCRLLGLTLKCQHATTKPRTPLVVKSGSAVTRLEVVPSEDQLRQASQIGLAGLVSAETSGNPLEPEDRIDLALDAACEQCRRHEHPAWVMEGAAPPPGSRRALCVAPAWTTGKPLPWIPRVAPRVQSVRVRSCQNVRAVQIAAYPCDKLDLSLDIGTPWELATDIVQHGLRKAAGAWVGEIRKGLSAAGKGLKGNTKATVSRAKQLAGQEATEQRAQPGGKLARKLGMNNYELSLEGHWTAFWREHRDHRAYYAYSLQINGSAEGRWEWRFSLFALVPGAQWYAALPSKVREQIADCYLFFAILLTLAVQGDVKRTSPDTPLFRAGGLTLTGRPGIEVGGAATIANGKLAKVSVSANTGLDLALSGGVDEEGWCLSGSAARPGLDLNIEAVLFDDTIFEIDRRQTYTLIPGGDPLKFRIPDRRTSRNA